jgi:gas vesicle protein
MEDDNKFSYFFLGLGLGVAAGLLFAPKSGPETRDMLMSKADEGKEYLKKRTTELQDQAAEVIDRGRSTVTRQRDNLVAAVEAGKQAYREAVTATPNDAEHI